MSEPRPRATLHTTVDPDLLAAVERYVDTHEGVNRAAVVDEALALWVARERDRATRAQFAPEELTEADRAERAAWTEIRRAAAARLFTHAERESSL